MIASWLRHSAQRQLPSIISLPRYVSTQTSPSSLNSTYYLQRFLHSDSLYILLLPQTSIPMGRIQLSKLPPNEVISTTGPTVEFIDPISADAITADWSTFVENGRFRETLQEVIRENIAQEEAAINDAKTLPGGSGWIHLCDERALPVFGRIPETEDILGSILVKDNQLQPETYQAMPTYRLVTRQGPMKLSSFLLGKLREKLRTE